MLKPVTFTPENLTNETTVLLTTNHFGASIYGPSIETFGDSGKDAQYLANASGCQVIGLDRPYTGNSERYNRKLVEAMRSQPEAAACRWVKAVQPAITETGASRVELIGRSAGSNLLLEVALLELLPVSAILTVDPVAIFAMPIWRGKLRYAKYQALAGGKATPQPQNDCIAVSELAGSFTNPDTPLTSLRRMIVRQLGDAKQYQSSWATNSGYLAAALIAVKLRHTTARFAFAGYPLAGERQRLKPVVSALNSLRGSKPHEAPAVSEFIDGTTHSSFDKPKNYIAEYLRLKELERSYRLTFEADS